MVATPHFYTHPTVFIETTEVECHFQMVTLVPEVFRTADIETYCNPGGEAPAGVRWNGIFRIRMSYGSDSSWEFFSALDALTTYEVTIWPGDDTSTSTANPEAQFDAYIEPLAFIPEHEVGGSATFDVAFHVVGEPDFATT